MPADSVPAGPVGSTAHPHRPALAPGVTVLRRSAGEVQVGVHGGPSFVLAGLAGLDTALLLSRLDGRATRESLSPRVAAAVDLLREAGLVVDAATPSPGAPAGPAARARARVDVVGGGRLGTAVAGLLAAEGVGDVDVSAVGGPCEGPVCGDDVAPWGPHARDVCAPWAAAARAVVRRARTVPRPPRAPARPDLVVLCGSSATLAAADALLAADRPHLVVAATGGTARVGPLVVPGLGPCVRCLELHRTDRDPAWPLLHAQLLGHPARDAPTGPVLVTTAAAFAVQHVLAVLDSPQDATDLPAVGAAWDCRTDDLVWRRRSWGRHPACGCGWPAAESA